MAPTLYRDTGYSLLHLIEDRSTAGIVKISFETSDGKDVCVVSVAAAGKPTFARPLSGGQAPTDFWVRIGNATRQLHGEDMTTYQAEHWG